MKHEPHMTIIISIALLCITILEFYALFQGIDGILLTGVIGTLAAIPTWFIARKTVRKGKHGK